jgi:hypothetical protein
LFIISRRLIEGKEMEKIKLPAGNSQRVSAHETSLRACHCEPTCMLQLASQVSVIVTTFCIILPTITASSCN